MCAEMHVGRGTQCHCVYGGLHATGYYKNSVMDINILELALS